MFAQMVSVLSVLAQTGYKQDTSDVDLRPIIGYWIGQFIVGGVIGWFIGVRKNRPVAGLLLGGLFGCLGWIITAVLTKKRPFPSY